MKHDIPFPDLVKNYLDGDKNQRREQVFLAVEAELDATRPFEIDWGPSDLYFSYEDNLYFYRYNGENFLESRSIENKSIEITEITPHLAQFLFR